MDYIFTLSHENNTVWRCVYAVRSLDIFRCIFFNAEAGKVDEMTVLSEK